MNEELMIQQEEGWTRPIKSKRGKKLLPVIALAMLAVFFVAGNLGLAWADTTTDNSGITIKATDAIKNDPTAMKVLENIELFKQRWALEQQAQQLEDQQNQFIEQQRAIANAYLQNDLARISNKDQISSQNAFANFASTINSPAQNVFLDEFNYMQEKVQQARDAKNQVLQNGGTIEQAIQAFNNVAASQKDKLVSVNAQLNVKYNLADQKVQSLFDKWGSISRN